MAGPPRSTQQRSAHLPGSRVPAPPSSPSTAALPRVAAARASHADAFDVMRAYNFISPQRSWLAHAPPPLPTPTRMPDATNESTGGKRFSDLRPEDRPRLIDTP